MANNEEHHTSAMVDAVRDFALKLERHTQHGDDERKKLINEVNATVAAMRKDFWDTTVKIQRDASQHRDEHTVERGERSNRQMTHDVWMGALTLLGLINLLLVLYIVSQGR